MAAVTLLHPRDANVPQQIKPAAMVSTTRNPSPETSFQILDRAAHAAISGVTAGLSPAALAEAFFDWWVHLALSPGKQLDLARQAITGAVGNPPFAAQAALGLPRDPRSLRVRSTRSNFGESGARLLDRDQSRLRHPARIEAVASAAAAFIGRSPPGKD